MVHGNNRRIKLVTMNVLRQKGFENIFEFEQEAEEKSKKGTKNKCKLQESISRTKNHIFDLAFCNEWQYFITLTLDKNKYDRTNLTTFRDDFSHFIRNYNRNHKLNIKYLIVPELHEDNISWHFHGFVMGLPLDNLVQFKRGMTMGKKIADKVKLGQKVYFWPKYQDKFGFNDFEIIRNSEAVSKYITKYINKGLETTITDLNAHKYYCSKNLNTSKLIDFGYFEFDKFKHWYEMQYEQDLPIFEAKYCTITWLEYSNDLFEAIKKFFYNYE